METNSSKEQIAAWREELLGYLKDMYAFKEFGDPHEILKTLSGLSVRARFMSQICAGSQSREAKDFRYEEVIPFLQEAEFQRQIWSRVGTLIKDEWEMSKG